MKQVCLKNCQVRLDGRIAYIHKGSVIEFNDSHPCLTPIDGEKLDFLTASEALLTASAWKFSDANKVMEETFGKTLKREQGTKKSEIIEQILDIRYRSLGIDLNKVV